MAAMPRNMTGIGIKMSAAGYSTHMFGKWDAGMATMDHTPHGRGYQTALHYFHPANDSWTYEDGGVCRGGTANGSHSMVDMWQTNLDAPGTQGPAHGWNNTCGGDNHLGDKCSVHGPKSDHWYGGYEDSVFAQQVLRTVAEHTAAEPYFLFWAPHIVHAPLQVPPSFYHKFDFMAATDRADNTRQTYHAMVDFADAAIGNFTTALKAKNMWDDIVIVFSADNGGPVYQNGTAGANNYPLKGGKTGQWEGGVRTRSHCRLYYHSSICFCARFTKIFGASVSETAMRSNSTRWDSCEQLGERRLPATESPRHEVRRPGHWMGLVWYVL
jgi:arylsulfatase I/J